MTARAGVVAGLACACAVLTATAASAQHRTAAPRPGDRVRVDFIREVPGDRFPILREARRSGTVMALDSTTLTLAGRNDRTLEVPMVRIERLGIGTGHSRDAGGRFGAAWGVLGGFLVALLTDVTDDRKSPGSGRYVAGLGAGALVGWLAGYGFGAETFADVPRTAWLDARDTGGQ